MNTKKIKATYRNGVIEPLNKINLSEEIFQNIVDENIRGFLSVISITEFVAKPLADKKETDVDSFKQFLVSLPVQVLEVNYEIAELTDKLRLKIKKLLGVG